MTTKVSTMWSQNLIIKIADEWDDKLITTVLGAASTLSNIVKTARLKDKAQKETIPNIWNGTIWWPCLTYKRLAQVRRHKLSFLFLTVRPLWSVMQDRFSPPLGQPMPFYSSHANSKQAWRMCIFIADKFAKCPKICDCVKFIRGCMSGLLLQAWKKRFDWYDWLIEAFCVRLKKQESQLSLTNRATHCAICNGVADPPKTCTSPNVLPCRIWSLSALKGVGINTGEPQNWGSLELRSLGMGGVADPKKQAPPPRVLPHQIWYFCDKGCTHK